MITDFGEDIKREKAHLHNPYLRQVTYNKFGTDTLLGLKPRSLQTTGFSVIGGGKLLDL